MILPARRRSTASGLMMARVRSVIAADYSRRYLSISRERQMTPMAAKQADDPDLHKGAIEGDNPTDELNVEPRDKRGVDDNGMPNDPVATAQDKEGANADNTQG